MTYRWNKILISVIIPFVLCIPFLLMGIDMDVLLGCVAYILFIYDVILGLRPKIVEKWIDLQNMYFAHGITALFAVLFATLHVNSSHLDGFAETIGDLAWYLSLAITGLALVFLTSQIGRIIPILKYPLNIIQKIAKKFFFTREVNVWIHMLSPLIVVFIYIHVLCIDSYRTDISFMGIFTLYFAIFLIAYLYYGIYKKITPSHYRVQNIIKLNSQTYELVIRYQRGSQLKIKGGQFIFIHTKQSKWNEYHPFSVLSVDNNSSNELRLGIRVSGDYTKSLLNIHDGDEVLIRGVYGHFVAPRHVQNVIAIGGGIGITPCISLMQSLPEQASGTLIWSVRYKEDILFHDELEKLKHTHPYVQIIIHITSEKGHLNYQVLSQYIDPKVHTKFYICGPAAMTDSMTHLLLKEGVQRRDITTEGFIF